MTRPLLLLIFFFFNDTATTEIYTLSLHDALPICHRILRLPDQGQAVRLRTRRRRRGGRRILSLPVRTSKRSEEHTSELQSLAYLVCRLLLEKKENKSHIKSHAYSGWRLRTSSARL